VTIVLTREQAELVQHEVESGRFDSPEAALDEALRLLRRRRTERLDAVREKIEIGLEQARRGELRDADEVFAELFAKLPE